MSKLKIDETKTYSKLVKEPNSKHPWNVAEGVVREGKLKASLQYVPRSVSLETKASLYVEDGNWYIRTSTINDISELPDGGYKIVTNNSTYILT